MERETSTVLAKVLMALWSKRLTKADIARDLAIPLEEIETLIFGLARLARGPSREKCITLVTGA